MAATDSRTIQILGGSSLLKAGIKKALRKSAGGRKGKRSPSAGGKFFRKSRSEEPDLVLRTVDKLIVDETNTSQSLEPGELGWTKLIRWGLPAESTKVVAEVLRMSVADLAESLRLPARTIHRRLEKGEALTPEESERNVRAARVLAKAQELLGDENGRGWTLSRSRGLGGEVPLELLDTADGFTAVMDELGRLEHGVLS